MTRINSNQKGKRGEREAAKFLKSLGYQDARRTQQYNGLGLSDVICPNSLPDIHIEVKYLVAKMDFGTKNFSEAWEQSVRDCGDKTPVLLWKRQGCRTWLMTYETVFIYTVSGSDCGDSLEYLQQTALENKEQTK